MMVLYVEKVFVIEWYFRTSSFKTIADRWAETFPNSAVPSKSSIKRITDHFRMCWTKESKKKKDQPPSVPIPDKLYEISKKISATPGTSVRKLAVETGIYRSTNFHGLKKLKLLAYRATIIQELKPHDMPRRLKFCR